MTKPGVYLILINALACLLMHVDKKKSQQNRFRIPEKVLLGIGLLGGALGEICGMVWFHHKTRKPAFSVGLPLMFFLQLAALAFWFT